MQITDEILDKVARLARLELEESTREQVRQDFARMLDFVDKLREVNTEGVEPLFHITEEVNHLRSDKADEPISRERALSQAPDHDRQFFLVPKVVEKSDK